MRNVIQTTRQRKSAFEGGIDLAEALTSRIVGQPEAVDAIMPYLRIYQAGLSPEGRPAGVFLLLGPSGTGKTRTVEALAECIHGSAKSFLRVDCGEYQMEHEVAKLIGAPPGYLGHRETTPILTQARLNAVTTERSGLSIVLFDEIEKAAPSMARLLLGVLDKATLRLGDNNTVNFERSLIFLTSNLGAREMMRAIKPEFGFAAAADGDEPARSSLHAIGLQAVRRKFAPEFVNRIDALVTYRLLSNEALSAILEQQLVALQEHITHRLGVRGFQLELDGAAKTFLLGRGTSSRYGARELKRTIHQFLLHPLAGLVAAGEVEPGGTVRVELAPDGERLTLAPNSPRRRPRAA